MKKREQLEADNQAIEAKMAAKRAVLTTVMEAGFLVKNASMSSGSQHN